MTLTTAMTTVGVLLALLLISAAWVGRRPAWQIVFGAPEESTNRITLTEFYVEARNRGWDFAADTQLCLDLAIGLREAGLAGSIEMWGRKCRTKAILTAPDEPLLGIPATFWKHHLIDGLRMAIAGDADQAAGPAAGLETNNALIRTQAMPTRDADFEDATYKDIHLNYIQAMNWLQTDANPYQGISRRGVTAPAPAKGPGER